MPAQSDYSPTTWGQSPYEELEMPSGQLCLVKRLDLEDIVAAGLIDEFDKISPTVEEKVVAPAKGKRLPAGKTSRPAKKPTKAEMAKAAEETRSDFLRDADAMTAITTIMARILPQIVMKPAIVSSVKQVDGNWVTIPHDEREDGKVYVDSIPILDRMHIFGWAMEGMDMEKLQQFREQSATDLAVVEPRQEPPRPPE